MKNIFSRIYFIYLLKFKSSFIFHDLVRLMEDRIKFERIKISIFRT
ncbi:hypothetical protein RIEPE_0419 [Candidatus Riesia pediculicola USDA]|uniref:Uncharacterized protein n=1 Tax=Riesia pediculicola (strain USDA) TaxID=515618 RepID=D4G8K4_RIEPU|nr:hypothetical protein RIEPE_0419 [Candidatus Riesia pediculicola USDA]